MIVVSNTSPIINLATIGYLDLLQSFYTQIFIPDAVYQEIAVRGAGQPGANEVQTLAWIQRQTVANKALVKTLELDLDSGEAEAITLAIELKADLLLLDERQGYAVASRLGVKLIGTLGVLIRAKNNQIVPAIKPLVDDLITIAGFWIDNNLYTRVLGMVGE